MVELVVMVVLLRQQTGAGGPDLISSNSPEDGTLLPALPEPALVEWGTPQLSAFAFVSVEWQ